MKSNAVRNDNELHERDRNDERTDVANAFPVKNENKDGVDKHVKLCNAAGAKFSNQVL